MSETECVFCNCKTSHREKILFENKTVIVRLDQAPAVPGHMQVLPKDHYVNLADVPANVWADILEGIKAGQKIISTIDLKEPYAEMLADPYQPEFNRFLNKVLASPFLNKKPDAFTVGINDGKAAGRYIDHLHIHVIPRFLGDIEHPEGGIRAIFGDAAY